MDDVRIIIILQNSCLFTANPPLSDCNIPLGCPLEESEVQRTDNGYIDMGDCDGPPKRCRPRNMNP